jgi:D-alanyl-D-alanine carboxypeptidase
VHLPLEPPIIKRQGRKPEELNMPACRPTRTSMLAATLLVAACGQSVGPSIGPTDRPPATSAATQAASQAPVPTEPAASRAPLALFPAYPSTAIADATAMSLQSVLDGLVANGSPDAVAAVVTADGYWAGAAGVDGPDGRVATPTDVFNIASISKLILAAYFLRLAQDAKVDLDAPLSGYLGDLPIDANGATVRQALEMRAGFGDTPASALTAASDDCSRVWSRTDALASVPTPVTAPGGAFVYSNPAYKVLGYAAEEISGMSLDAAFDATMFSPLGLDRIGLQTATRATPKPWALPIGRFGGGVNRNDFGIGGTLPCVSLSTFSFSTSAVASDAPSLGRWAWGLFAGELIDQAGLTQMTTPFDGVHALGIEILKWTRSDLTYGVHGGNAGYAAFLAVTPGRPALAVVLMNDEDADVETASRLLLTALSK